MDYTSLYPTSIMSFNLSRETFIASEKGCKQIGIDIEEVVQQLKDDNINYIDTGHDESLFGDRYLFYAQDYKLFWDLLHNGTKFKYLLSSYYVLNITNNISTNKKDEQKYYSQCVKNNIKPVLKI